MADDLAAIEEELHALLEAQTGEPLLEYIGRHSPQFGPPAWASIVSDIYERARFERVRVCLSVPPRHGKTYSTLHAIAKQVKEVPADTNAYFTYNDDRAKSKSRIARDFVRRDSVALARDMHNLGEWRTSDGGGLLAGGVATGVTGEGVSGVFVVDDPFKDRQDADSARRRQIVWEWFNSAAITRLEGASVVVIQTRWHDDDIIGRLEDLGGWEIINLPAVAESDDPLGREPGEPLDPIRFPLNREDSPHCLEALNEIRAQIGEFEWSALYQGRPRPRGNKVFGSPVLFDPKRFDPRGFRLCIGVDTAASEKTTADYSVAVVLAVRGRGLQAEGYVLDVLRRQVQVPAFVESLVQLQRGYMGALCAIEAVGLGKAIPQMVKRVDPRLRVLEVPARGDKFTRAQGVAAAWNSGRVFVPTAAPWLPDFLDELDRFTGVKDKHDDQVDALAHAWNAIAFAGGKPRRGARSDVGRYV